MTKDHKLAAHLNNEHGTPTTFPPPSNNKREAWRFQLAIFQNAEYK